MTKMAEDIDGWGAADMPLDGYASDQEADFTKLVKTKNKTNKKNKMKQGTAFQAMGLGQQVLQGILRKGYRNPTPIQKKTIPIILEGKDVVAMARTGSGKTAAFLVPLFEKLKIHSAKVGARALIMSPTRELAMQTLSFAKELGKFTNLRAATVLGGDSIESQFAALHDNPDVIIATPGRFAHVCTEMKLKLDSVEYVVFDEADRLFEMGFQEQLTDVIRRLRTARQTVLFSATLPKILVDFARAGLSDPVLIRLDVENKIPENLKLGFFKVNVEDKVPILIHFLLEVIPYSEQTVVFLPTRHHVEYLHGILKNAGIETTYVYSSLHPTARKENIRLFRSRKSTVMLVTDLAARGIDIPLLDNVINFNFPSKSKLFVHRVGRVARAQRKGVAYSFVAPDEVSYLLDLNTLLSQSISVCPSLEEGEGDPKKWDDWHCMFGKVPQDVIDDRMDTVRRIHAASAELETLKKSEQNAHKKYVKTRPPSSNESVKKLKGEFWGREMGMHPLFVRKNETKSELQRLSLLKSLSNVRPKKTVFEIKESSNTQKCQFMAEKRETDRLKIKAHHEKVQKIKENAIQKKKEKEEMEARVNQLEKPGESDISSTFKTEPDSLRRRKQTVLEKFSRPDSNAEQSQKDSFVPYLPADYHMNESYSVKSSFEKESSRLALDLIDDEGATKMGKPTVTWNRKRKKFVSENQEKKIKTESGAWVSASYKKDLYEKWKLKMNPHHNENDESCDPDESTPDWRSGKDAALQKSRGFISLTETNNKFKPHPLSKNMAASRRGKGGSRQLRSYEQMKKYTKDAKKKIHFQKTRQKKNQISKAKHSKKK